MKPVGWAYWLNDHWHLCADEPTAHKERQLVYLAQDVKELEAELDAAHDARIEAQNPGIDMDYVRYHRRKARAALDTERSSPPPPLQVDRDAITYIEKRGTKRCTCTEPPDLPHDEGCPKHGELERTRRIRADE